MQINRKLKVEVARLLVLFLFSFAIIFIIHILVKFGFDYFKLGSFFYKVYDFYYIEDVLVGIHLVGGVIPSLISLVTIFLGTLIQKRDYLLKFLALFVFSTCISSVSTNFYSEGIGSEPLISWLATSVIVLTGLFLHRKRINQLLLPLTIYSSVALGHLITDFYKLPLYIGWCRSKGIRINPVIGGGSFLDGIFIWSFSGLIASVFIIKIWEKSNQ